MGVLTTFEGFGSVICHAEMTDPSAICHALWPAQIQKRRGPRQIMTCSWGFLHALRGLAWKPLMTRHHLSSVTS